VEEALAELDAALDGCRAVSAWALPEAHLVAWSDRLRQTAEQLNALWLAAVRELDGRAIPGAQGATSTTAWLRDRYRISGPAAARTVRLAAAIDAVAPATRVALEDGTVNAEQATVIAAALADLPETDRAKGEALLVEQAAVFGPKELGTLGRHLFEVIDPERAAERAQQAIDAAEQRAHDRRGVSLTDLTDTHQVRIHGYLDPEGAAIVRAALSPLCSPRTRARSGPPSGQAPVDAAPDEAAPDEAAPDVIPGSVIPGSADTRTPAQRRADALVDICRLFTTDSDLPDNGGQRPHVTVTVEFEALRKQLAVATLDDGGQVSATAARRLACDATILPAVLDGASQVLDLGRQRRLFSGPLRQALNLRDGGCAFPACDRPPRWCDGHHIVHWADGGTTDMRNAVLLCAHHHRLIHHTDWRVTINPVDGRPDFIPPRYIDPNQRPQRNRYHSRQ
jgi:hypothetical protein